MEARAATGSAKGGGGGMHLPHSAELHQRVVRREEELCVVHDWPSQEALRREAHSKVSLIGLEINNTQNERDFDRIQAGAGVREACTTSPPKRVRTERNRDMAVLRSPSEIQGGSQHCVQCTSR